jgi:hypothetical protein
VNESFRSQLRTVDVQRHGRYRSRFRICDISRQIVGAHNIKGETEMRFMVIVKANRDTEAGVLPTKEILEQMGNFNEELVKAGVMLAGEGLQASSKGARVKFAGGKTTVIDGPFAETKELTIPRSRFARCLRRPTLATTSRPN